MNPQNTYFDLPSFVNRYMAESIEKYHFDQEKGYGDVLLLSNPHCIIFLQNFGEGVGFSFSSKELPDVKHHLTEYLDAMMEGGYYRYCPKAPEGLGMEESFVRMLRGYNGALMADALAAPLGGDFSWVEKLVAYNEERARLGQELTRLEVIDEHPESDAIWHKKLNGDLTWMDDVRRILAEQESKS
jgi:hypothetical protein